MDEKIKPKPVKNKSSFNIYWIYGILFVIFIALNFFDFSPKSKEVQFSRLKNMISANDVEKVVIINREQAEIYLKPESVKKEDYNDLGDKEDWTSSTKPQYYYIIPTNENVQEKITLIEDESSIPDNLRVKIKNETRKDYFYDMLSWILPLVIIVVLWMYFFRRMSGGAGGSQIFNIGKSKAKLFDKEAAIKVDFKDVAGLEGAKEEVMEIVEFLKNPKKYTELGGKIPKGALLVGPPGTGKTLLAKAVAGEANVPFFSLSGSDFVEMFVGVGASRVRDLFKQAKEKAPCIVFIDEIDAIGRSRGRGPSFNSNDERENTLNQLLTEMDGFDSNSGVIILAATNRADILDRALIRAGRFDRQIHVELPDLLERVDIFKVHLRPLKTAENLDIDFLSKQTPGFSGADIANICNEAALIAARKNRKAVEKQDFLDAVDRIIGGLEKRNKLMTPKEKETIAFHEAGHATVSWFLEHASPLVKVTIIPRGKSLGAAWYLPEERYINNYDQIMDELCATLGGRAAEDLILNKVSTGALNDLERVTKQTYALVAFFGMSDKLANISYFDSSGQSDFGFTRPYSEKTAETIDQEVKSIVNIQYLRAKQVLSEHIEGLRQLAQRLLEKEVIFSDDLEEIFGKNAFHKEEINKTAEPQAEIPVDIIQPKTESHE
jgi:cell division protease FtsH